MSSTSQNSKKRSVLIGMVAFDGMLPETQRAAFKAFYDLGKYYSDKFDFVLEIAMKREQFRAKNYLTNLALRLGCDYMLQIDDDTVLNPNTFEVLLKMLDDDEDAAIAGCLYLHKGGDQHPVVMWLDINPAGDLVADYYQMHELTGDVMEVGVTGGGCMMFRVAAFKELIEPYFWNEADLGTDMQICMRMHREGWKVLCHTGHEIGHVGVRKVWYPSAVDGEVADMIRFNERLYYDLLAYLGINADEYRSLLVKSNFVMSMKWLELAPETAEEMAGVYRDPEFRDSSIARNIFYNSKRKRDWGQLTTYVKRNKPKTGLDYGCGTGMATQIMAENGVNVTAMDLDCGPLDFLEWRAKRHKFADKLRVVRIIDPDGRKHIPDENFDVIVVKDVLEHLTNPEEVLVELLSRLNPRGLLVCNTHVADFKRADEGQPQHLDLLSDEKFLGLCQKHGVLPWYGCLLRKEH